MATRVFGPGVEPGGMDLDDNHDEVQCPACKGKAIARYWEACEGGAINAYNNIHCTVCGHFEGDTGEGDEYDHLFESGVWGAMEPKTNISPTTSAQSPLPRHLPR